MSIKLCTLLLGVLSLQLATAAHETPTGLTYSTPRPPPPPAYTAPVNVIVTAQTYGAHLNCQNAQLVLSGILDVYVDTLYIPHSEVECTNIGPQIIMRFYTEDNQKAHVVGNMLAEKAWLIAHGAGAPCGSLVVITTNESALSRDCSMDAQFCCRPPPPPPPPTARPPPPPPSHYIRDCPPPPYHIPVPTNRKPPPPWWHIGNPPPPYQWAHRPPSAVPCNSPNCKPKPNPDPCYNCPNCPGCGHNPDPCYNCPNCPGCGGNKPDPCPNCPSCSGCGGSKYWLYRAITVRAPKCWGNMYLSPLYVDHYLCPSLLDSLMRVMASYGLHEGVDYSVDPQCIINYQVSNNYVYYKYVLHMSPEAWLCLYNACVHQDTFAVLVHEANIICGSSFRIYDAPPDSSMLVYNDERNQPSLNPHEVDQRMCAASPDPRDNFYRYLNDHL